jgi:hypothetical protein
MTDTAFQRLTAMWQSGDINDDEFKLATKYLKEERAKAQTGNGNGTADRQRGVSARLLAMVVGPARVQQWPPYRRRFVEIGLSLVLGVAAIVLVVQLYSWLLAASWENDWPVSPMLATIGTLVAVAVVGMFTGLNGRAVPIVAVPLFLFLMFSPMLGSDEPAARPATRSVTASQLSALEKMEVVFQGDYSRDQIGALVDATLRNFGSVPTENTRERLGDMLVALRKDGNAQEMEILRCMYAMGPSQMELAYAAATCATMLEAK